MVLFCRVGVGFLGRLGARALDSYWEILDGRLCFFGVAAAVSLWFSMGISREWNGCRSLIRIINHSDPMYISSEVEITIQRTCRASIF